MGFDSSAWHPLKIERFPASTPYWTNFHQFNINMFVWCGTFAPTSRTPILRFVFRIFKITFRAQLFWPKILGLLLNKLSTLLFHWLFESIQRHQKIMMTCFKPHFLAQRTSVPKILLFRDVNYLYFSILGYV